MSDKKEHHLYYYKPIHTCLISADFGEGSEAGVSSHGGIQHKCPSGSRAPAELGQTQRKQAPSAPPKRASAVPTPQSRAQEGATAVKPGEEARQGEHAAKQCAPSAAATLAAADAGPLGLANAADFTVVLVVVASSFNDQTPSAPAAAATTTTTAAAARAPAGLLR